MSGLELVFALGGVDVGELTAVVAEAIGSRVAWDTLASFCEIVMTQKKALKRIRETDSNAARGCLSSDDSTHGV